MLNLGQRCFLYVLCYLLISKISKMMCVFKKIVKTRENFRIHVQISGPNSNFRTFQDKFQNFRTTPRPAYLLTMIEANHFQHWVTARSTQSMCVPPVRRHLVCLRCLVNPVWKPELVWYAAARNLRKDFKIGQHTFLDGASLLCTFSTENVYSCYKGKGLLWLTELVVCLCRKSAWLGIVG